MVQRSPCGVTPIAPREALTELSLCDVQVSRLVSIRRTVPHLTTTHTWRGHLTHPHRTQCLSTTDGPTHLRLEGESYVSRRKIKPYRASHPDRQHFPADGSFPHSHHPPPREEYVSQQRVGCGSQTRRSYGVRGVQSPIIHEYSSARIVVCGTPDTSRSRSSMSHSACGGGKVKVYVSKYARYVPYVGWIHP